VFKLSSYFYDSMMVVGNSLQVSESDSTGVINSLVIMWVNITTVHLFGVIILIKNKYMLKINKKLIV